MPPDQMPMPAEPGGPPAAMPAEGQGGMKAPPPPRDGYSKAAVVDLVSALNGVVDAIVKAVGSEKPAPMEEPPKEVFDKTGKLRASLPVWLVQAVHTIVNDVLARTGGAQEGRYDVDLDELLRDDAGLERLVILLELASKDRTLLLRLKEAGKAEGAPPPAPKAKPGPMAKAAEAEPANPGNPGPPSVESYM